MKSISCFIVCWTNSEKIKEKQDTIFVIINHNTKQKYILFLFEINHVHKKGNLGMGHQILSLVSNENNSPSRKINQIIIPKESIQGENI